MQVKEFITQNDAARRDSLAADSEVAETSVQLTDAQKAQQEASAKLKDSTDQLTAVVSAFPDGVITGDGRFFEVIRGVGLKETTPRHDDQIGGELVHNQDGSYVFNPDPAPVPEPEPTPVDVNTVPAEGFTG